MLIDHLLYAKRLLHYQRQNYGIKTMLYQKKKKTLKNHFRFCSFPLSYVGPFCHISPKEYILYPHLVSKFLEVIHLLSTQDTAIPIKLISTLEKILVKISAIGYIKLQCPIHCIHLCITVSFISKYLVDEIVIKIIVRLVVIGHLFYMSKGVLHMIHRFHPRNKHCELGIIIIISIFRRENLPTAIVLITESPRN